MLCIITINTMSNQKQPETYNNKYDNSSSKMRRIYIPLPGYKHFHKPSDAHDIDPHFIGRERIKNKLEQWLSDKNENYAGSYLVTGYRGMGKSSFVGKVINSLIDSLRTKKLRKSFEFIKLLALLLPLFTLFTSITFNNNIYIYHTCIILIFPLLAICIYPFNQNKWFNKIVCNNSINNKVIWTLSILFCIIIVVLICQDIQIIYNNALLILYTPIYAILFYLSLKGFNSRYIHHITVNIGNETKGERDVLALIAKSINERIFFFISERQMYRPLFTLVQCK